MSAKRKKKNNIRFSRRYFLWRKLVLKRDGYVCACGSKKRLHAHHIKLWEKYPKLRFDVENGRIVCYECHKKIHPFMQGYEKKPLKKKKVLINKRMRVVTEIPSVKTRQSPFWIWQGQPITARKSKYERYRYSADSPNPNWTS